MGLLFGVGLLGETELFGLREPGALRQPVGRPPGGGTPTLKAWPRPHSTCSTLSGGGRSARKPSSRLRFIASCWSASGDCRMLRSCSRSGAGRLASAPLSRSRRATACRSASGPCRMLRSCSEVG